VGYDPSRLLPAPNTGIMKKKILIVDDEDDIRHFLELVLRQSGYDVYAAAGGEECLARAPQLRPDLILLDIMMPVIDGWEVLRQLKERADTAPLPVAILSARTEAKDRARGMGAGAVDYIGKPFALHELLKRIENIFKSGGDGAKVGGDA
jgi:DNA-binding response OmpR family regulator